MADDDQQYGLQAVDHDPFAVDPMAEPAAISLPPDQPKPEASPQTTPAPAGDGWDRWGAVGGAMKLATAVAHPGSFTNLVADKLSNLSMPTREQWQTGEQALGHTAEHLATLPMRIADKLGLLETPTATETPGQVSESDVEKEQARAAAEGTFGASTALQMVLGGPGAAEEGAAGVAGGVLRQPTFEENPARVDQRLPRTKKPIEGDDGAKNVDTDSMRLTPKLYENNVGLVRNYPGVKIPPRASTDAAADAFVNHVSDNLQWLYDQVPGDIKFRSAQWYDGGNKIVKDWAQQYGVPESTTAGVIAATSPQKDWFNNVSIAKRILDQMRGDPNFYKTQKMTPEMEQFFRDTPSLNKPENQPIVDEIRGKSLADIDRIMPYPKDERDIYKAMWIRLYDQAHTDPSYPLITPEGTFGPKVTTKYSSEPTSVAWGSLPEIAKAVNVVDANGNQSVLANTIGMRHKVRNFYNNLISPNSAAGDVTVDTHAVAAGLLRPVSANSTEVAHNFGNWPGKDLPAAKNSAKTGIFGTYPLYADAYRKAAEQLGILPRQLQSVTWEAVRGLFPEDWKSAKNSAIIDNIWRQYRAGKETLDGARQRILNTTGGIQPPSWYRPARANNAPTQGAGNAPELFEPRIYGPGSQPSFTGTGRGTTGGASAPVVRPSPRDFAYEFDFGAGAPYNTKYPDWANLSGDHKNSISKVMLDKIADFATRESKANEYARLHGLGGWHEFTNPSFKSRLIATPDVGGDFADMMGYLGQQTKIMGYTPDPAGDRLALALHGDGLGDQKKLAAFWKDVNDKYPEFSSGFSPTRNQRGQPGIEMLFDQSGEGMDARVNSELVPGLQRLADKHALGEVHSRTFRATEESREHDWTKDPTGGDYTSRLGARHGPDLLQRMEIFKREELEPELQRQIDAAQGTGPGRTGDRGAGVQETQGAPSLPFRAAASPVKIGSGITDERTAAVRAAATAAAGRPNLIGLPTQNITLAGKPFVPGPIGAIHDIAEKYMADAGLPYDPPKTFVKVDKDRARRVAQAFDDMKHAPDNPKVKASYDAMAKETVAQYRALKDSGIKFEFIKPGMDDPYAENPRAAAKDVIENKHLWVFPTEGGFGSGSESAEAAMKSNPLLRPSGVKIEGKEVPVNDLFRIVHDVFGHLKDGVGFRADGEENAWRSHSAMYSDAARPAMTSETRGQNSWVNYGPHGEFNRTASGADTKYADQKIGLLPKWAVDEGRGDTHNFEPVNHNPFVLGSGQTSGENAPRVAAAVNSATKPQWSDQGGTVKRLEDGFYRAYDKKGRLAGALVMDFGSSPKQVFKVAVKDQFRRKGVATAMYQAAERDHGDLTPSGALTDEGFSFWKGYRPEAVKDDLRMHSKNLMGAPVSSRYGEGHISSVGFRAAIATTKGAESTWPVPKSELDRLIGTRQRAGGGTVSSTQPSLDKPSIWQSVRDRAYSAPKDEFNPDNTGIDIIPGAHLPDEQRGGMKARDIRGSASGGPVPPRGGDIGNVQSTVAPLVQALDQAVPDFDPEALGFRPSTNVEDVRNKPDWQREIESMTRAPLGIPAHDWPGAAINTNFGVLRAHGGRVDPKNINPNPTPAQAAAGVYAKDHLHHQGLPLTIENAKGSIRRGVGKDGKPWAAQLNAHYGYIKRTEGADLDHVDIYLGDHKKAPNVYVIDQVDADTKKWDEHKVGLGFASATQFLNAYKRGFSDGKGKDRVGRIHAMSVSEFKEWLRHGQTNKPFRHVVPRSERVRDILKRHNIQTGV